MRHLNSIYINNYIQGGSRIFSREERIFKKFRTFLCKPFQISIKRVPFGSAWGRIPEGKIFGKNLTTKIEFFGARSSFKISFI